MTRARERPKKKVLASPIQPVKPKKKIEDIDTNEEVKSKGNYTQSKDIIEDELISQSLKEISYLELNKPTTPEEANKKLWVDVISGNRIQANGMAIEFIAPKTMEIEEVDVEYKVKL